MALAGDLFEDRVAVLVSVVEGTEDDGVDVAADEVGTDGAVFLFILVAVLVLGLVRSGRGNGAFLLREGGRFVRDVDDLFFVFAMGKFLIHRESPS